MSFLTEGVNNGNKVTSWVYAEAVLFVGQGLNSLYALAWTLEYTKKGGHASYTRELDESC